MRLHPAIRKRHIVVSSYDYNASRTSLQTIVILNAKSGNHIKTLLFRQFARLYHEILHPKHPLGRDDAVKWKFSEGDRSGGAESRNAKI